MVGTAQLPVENFALIMQVMLQDGGTGEASSRLYGTIFQGKHEEGTIDYRLYSSRPAHIDQYLFRYYMADLYCSQPYIESTAFQKVENVRSHDRASLTSNTGIVALGFHNASPERLTTQNSQPKNALDLVSMLSTPVDRSVRQSSIRQSSIIGRSSLCGLLSTYLTQVLPSTHAILLTCRERASSRNRSVLARIMPFF